MADKLYTIQDLSELTGISRRTIRYYIAEGLLDPPAGRGRGGFYYDTHVMRLKEIRAWQEKGLPLSAIPRVSSKEAPLAEAHAREVWARIVLCPGLEIHIRRDLEERERRRLDTLLRLGKTLFGGEEE